MWKGTYDEGTPNPIGFTYPQSNPSPIPTFPHLGNPSSFFDIHNPFPKRLDTLVQRLLEVHILRHSRHGLCQRRKVDRWGRLRIGVGPDLIVN